MTITLINLLSTREMIIFLIANLIVFICVLAVIAAVVLDFSKYQKRNEIKKEKKSIVETGTMFIFFFLFYLLIRLGIGRFSFNNFKLELFIMICGLVLLVFGCAVNIFGRLNLGSNWSNQIKIYQDHYFVSKGMYGLVRHPLYASIIWMFFGASLVYINYSSFLATVFIFIPFMYYRARQEEKLLVVEFAEYKKYQKRVGMFFPKLIKKYEKI